MRLIFNPDPEVGDGDGFIAVVNDKEEKVYELIFHTPAGVKPIIRYKADKISEYWISPRKSLVYFQKNATNDLEFFEDDSVRFKDFDEKYKAYCKCLDNFDQVHVDLWFEAEKPLPFGTAHKKETVRCEEWYYGEASEFNIQINYEYYHQFPDGIAVGKLIEILSTMDPDLDVAISTTADCGYIHAGGLVQDVFIRPGDCVELYAQEE